MTPEQLSDAVGDDAAMSLMAMRAGLRVYVPKTATARFVGECGGDEKAAERFCKAFGGESVILPIGKRWRVQKLLQRGLSLRDVAITVGMTRRSVVQIASEAGRHHEPAPRDVA